MTYSKDESRLVRWLRKFLQLSQSYNSNLSCIMSEDKNILICEQLGGKNLLDWNLIDKIREEIQMAQLRAHVYLQNLFFGINWVKTKLIDSLKTTDIHYALKSGSERHSQKAMRNISKYLQIKSGKIQLHDKQIKEKAQKQFQNFKEFSKLVISRLNNDFSICSLDALSAVNQFNQDFNYQKKELQTPSRLLALQQLSLTLIQFENNRIPTFNTYSRIIEITINTSVKVFQHLTTKHRQSRRGKLQAKDFRGYASQVSKYLRQSEQLFCSNFSMVWELVGYSKQQVEQIENYYLTSERKNQIINQHLTVRSRLLDKSYSNIQQFNPDRVFNVFQLILQDSPQSQLSTCLKRLDVEENRDLMKVLIFNLVQDLAQQELQGQCEIEHLIQYFRLYQPGQSEFRQRFQRKIKAAVSRLRR